MKNSRTLALSAALASGLFVSVAAQSAPVPAGVVRWDFPRLGNCHEGMAFADGVTGVLVWGGGDELRLTVGRADLWDHRGGYSWTDAQSYTNIVALWRAGRRDELVSLFRKETPKGEPRNPYMLPLGRVVVKMPGAELKRGELDVKTGLGKIELADGRVVELVMSKESRAFAVRFPDGLGYAVSSVPSMDQPIARTALESIGFAAPAKRADGFDWSLPADPSVSLDFTTSDRELAVATRRGDAPKAAAPAFAKVLEESRAHWTRFWAEGARVNVPDPVLQRVYDYGMYRFGAMTDADGVPAGLQGPWLEDDRLVPWNGDYHFNINVQECYAPAFRGGHFANLKPLFDMILSWRPRLRENARKFCGIADGYVLPHSVDDRGVCIGGFWTGTIDHGSTAWMASYMFRYVKYSGDVAFLRESAYGFMKGAMDVYLAMMEEKDGVLSIPLGPSPEWGGSDFKTAVGRNPSFQLAACHRLAKDLADAAKLLGETPDPRWADVERRLPRFAVSGPSDGSGAWGSGSDRGIGIFEGVNLSESHRHHSHMAGIYPFDTIPRGKGENKELVDATYANWTLRGTGLWSGWCVPWASILHTDAGNAAAAVWLLRAWDAFYCDEGHGSHHNAVFDGFTNFRYGRNVMQMDGQCAAVAAVLELLVHEIDGEPRFFRGCPESWKDVSFENVALSDGRRVSGRRLDGVVTITPCGGDPSLPDIFPRGAAVLFIGDSVTHGGRAGDMNHHLGHGYQAEVAMRYMAYRPDLQVVFANRGVSGDTSSNVVARLKTDAFPFTMRENGFCGMMGTQKTDYVPDVASVLVGINDVQRPSPHFVPAEDYERNLRTILDAGFAANPKISFVLCEPFKVCHPGKDADWNLGADFLRRQGIVARLANEKGIPCVFFQRLFNEVLIPEFGRTRYWYWDRSHPTYAAHMRMADFWIESVADAFERRAANPALRPQPPKYEADAAWYEGFAARVAAARTADVVRLGAGELARERTENLLWALGHGLLDGAVATRVVVDVGEGNRVPGPGGERACTEEEIAEARAEIVRRIRAKIPKAVVELAAEAK